MKKAKKYISDTIQQPARIRRECAGPDAAVDDDEGVDVGEGQEVQHRLVPHKDQRPPPVGVPFSVILAVGPWPRSSSPIPMRSSILAPASAADTIQKNSFCIIPRPTAGVVTFHS